MTALEIAMTKSEDWAAVSSPRNRSLKPVGKEPGVAVNKEIARTKS